MESQSGTYVGADSVKYIVMHDGSVLAIERNKDGSTDLTKLDNPSGKSVTISIRSSKAGNP